VTITVLDRADRVVVSIRDDGASPHSVEHSLRKAHTALTYDMSSAEFGKNAAKNPGNAGPLHLANITTAAAVCPYTRAIRWSVRSAYRARQVRRAEEPRTLHARKQASTVSRKASPAIDA